MSYLTHQTSGNQVGHFAHNYRDVCSYWTFVRGMGKTGVIRVMVGWGIDGPRRLGVVEANAVRYMLHPHDEERY